MSRRLNFALLGLLVVGWVTPAPASGLRTHLWVADQIIAELKTDCRVSIGGADFDLAPDLCESIRNHPEAFRAGAIGPDGFPDFITGQVTTHPGIPDDWQTADWIVRLSERAASGPEIAFSAGYTVHAASDTFAHSYVNNYAGDIFELKDERNVERRHFVLEKYIDYLLPDTPDARALSVPAEFLAKQLIFDPDAARLAAKSGAAPHIASMYAVRVAIDALDGELRKIDGLAGELLGKLLAQQIGLLADLAEGQAALQAAQVALDANEKRLGDQKRLLETESRLLNAASEGLKRNKGELLASDVRAKAAREAINAAKAAVDSAIGAKASVQSSLIEVRRLIANTPAKVSKEVCGEVAGVCKACGFLCAAFCEPNKLVCHGVEIANDAYTSLVDAVAEHERQFADAENRLLRETNSLNANVLKADQEARRKLELQGLSAGLEAAEAVARTRYGVARKQYELELSATKSARKNVQELRSQVAELRRKVIDADAIEKQVREVVDRIRPISAFTTNWRNGIDRAGTAYIEAAKDSSIILVAGSGNMLSPYMQWLNCHGSVFTGVPFQIPNGVCEGQKLLEKLNAELDGIVERTLPEPFAQIYREVRDLKARIRSDVREKLAQAAIDLAKLAAPDQATKDLIDLLANPENATRAKLNDVLASSEDAGGKDLLRFENGADLIDRDIGLSGGKLNPTNFKALLYAGILSRTALLDRDGLLALTSRFGGDRTKLVMSSSPARYSVMMDMARSIDGNHQWQPFGLPYPRATSAPQPTEPDRRRFGYGPADARKGFPFFTSPELRRDVFSRLFPEPFIGGVGERRELQSPIYGFPTCAANPFPESSDASGNATASDLRCSGSSDAHQ
jgi:hypothetical protein